MIKRCGYVALLGRPNAGKSTLLNALIGDKVAVVSRKPQTTRNRILGITDYEGAQMLFLDTPGIHKGEKHLINSVMNQVAYGVASEADVLLYLVDVEKGFSDEDQAYLSRSLAFSKAPCMVILSRTDVVKQGEAETEKAALKSALEAFLSEPENIKHKDRMLSTTPWLLSAKRPESLRSFKDRIVKLLPESPWLFPEDDLTDLPRSFLCSELIREQVFRQLGQEIPYGCAVTIEALDFKPHIVVVSAHITLSRAAHKPILLGKGGSRIKSIGQAARESLEKHFDQKVYLDLSLKVKADWQNDQKLIGELAHLRELDHLPKLPGPNEA